MLDLTVESQTLAAFQDDPSELLSRIKTTGRAVTLTVNGEPQAVLQDPGEYGRMLDLLDAAEAREGILRGLADVAAGRTRPASEVFAELDREFGIQG